MKTIFDRIAAGERSAVAECIERYGGLVFSIARRLSASREDAEDVVQEIFVDLWKHAARFDSRRASEATFVAMIARRRAIDRLRASGHRPEIEPLSDPAEIPDADLNGMEVNIEASRALDVLGTLRADQRRVILMSVYQGMTHSEIARETNLPLGTVKSHILRGLSSIREKLAPVGTAKERSADQ